VRFILNRGAGDKGRVLSESTFATLTTPLLEDYAYGLWVRKENGRTVVSHPGSIGGFHAAIEAHMEDGFGLVFLCNAGIDEDLKKWIVSTVTAAFEGAAMPASPAVSAGPTQPDPREYAAAFQLAASKASGARGATLEFVAVEDHLFLKGEHGNILLQRMGTDLFRATGDAAGFLPFVFGRDGKDGKDGKGKVISVSQGAQWYAAEGFSDPIQPPAPKEYACYVGHFVNNGPEGPVARVFVRNGRLVMLLSEDEDAVPEPLEPLGPGLFRIGKAEYSPERARFDTVIDGEVLRLFVSGVPLYRMDIP
jgi:D-alanyl-D-alanine carboxypeptidase